MRFFTAFLTLLPRRPRLAIAAGWWWCLGKRQRARNRLHLAGALAPGAYARWIATIEPPPRVPPAPPGLPRISVILTDLSGPAADRTMASLEAQTLPDWELVLAGPAPARLPRVPRMALAAGATLAEAIAAASGTYVLPLRRDAILSPHALGEFATAAAAGADLIYADEDRITESGERHTPWFKPEWNADLFLAQDYLSGACLIARAAIPGAGETGPPGEGPGAECYALLLALVHRPGARIVHLPRVLAHNAAPEPAEAAEQAARLAVLRRRLAPLHATATAGAFGSVAVAWPLPPPGSRPLVSIIIPTRDRLDLLRACVAGLVDHTDWSPLEIIVVDNGSRDPATLAWLEAAATAGHIRVLRDPGAFNFSRLNNAGAAIARGTHLCLLNNDIEVMNPDWLAALMRHALRPGVGAVGARLLYADRTIQHAGVAIGLGGAAGHPHRFQREAERGYFARTHLAHEVSAVTAACLVVEAAKYHAVGGLDETGFAVAFNDVDFCLRLRSAGFRNIYEPAATLVHHESKSRRKDFARPEIERYRRELALLQSRWHTGTRRDPLCSPHFRPDSETFLIDLRG